MPSIPDKAPTAAGKFLQHVKHNVVKAERMRRIDVLSMINAAEGATELKRSDIMLALEVWERYQDDLQGKDVKLKTLLEALADFGIHAKTRAEKLQVNRLMLDCDLHGPCGGMDFRLFCQVVQSARESVHAASISIIFKAWKAIDKEASDALGEKEVLHLLEHLHPSLETDDEEREVVEKMIADMASESAPEAAEHLLSFPEVESLARRIREHMDVKKRAAERALKEQYKLRDELFQQFRSQLLDLHKAFIAQVSLAAPEAIRKDPQGRHALSISELVHLLEEVGLGGSRKLKKTPELLSKLLIGQEDVDFPAVLELMSSRRYFDMSEKESAVRTLFFLYDKDRSGELSMVEISHMLQELEMEPTSPQEQQSIAEMMEEVDTDGSGQFSLKELLFMIQRIGEKFVQISWKAEEKRAEKLGFSKRQLHDLREAFEDLDKDGDCRLGITEIERCVQLLGWYPGPTQLRELFTAVDEDESGHLNFMEFLLLVRKVLENLQTGGDNKVGRIGFLAENSRTKTACASIAAADILRRRHPRGPAVARSIGLASGEEGAAAVSLRPRSLKQPLARGRCVDLHRNSLA